MNLRPPASPGGRRLLVATAVARYVKNPGWDRPGLVDARRQVVDLFTGTLGYTHVSDLGLDPTAAQLTEHLRALCKNQIRAEDYLVVYLAGHGEILKDGGHVLLTADTDPADIDDALPTVALATKMLRGTRVQRLLLLLDTCYSGRGGNEFAAAALAGIQRDWTLTDASGLAVITSTQPFEQADTGAFPALLTTAVHANPTAGQVPATLALGAVVAAMNTHSTRPGHQQIGWATLGLTGEIPDFLPNPRHRPGMTDIDLHLQPARAPQTRRSRHSDSRPSRRRSQRSRRCRPAATTERTRSSRSSRSTYCPPRSTPSSTSPAGRNERSAVPTSETSSSTTMARRRS